MNHPFWVVSGKSLNNRPSAADVPEAERQAVAAALEGRWVEARHLQAGDRLVVRSGQMATVEELSARREKLKVYNLEVAGLHTYAVGTKGIVVHNKTTGEPLGGGSPCYEVMDGVRRAKAADLTGKPTIPAKIIGPDGKQMGPVTDVPIDALRSPHKTSIDVSTGPKMDRFMDTLRQTQKGSVPPPIQVTPGSRGPGIRNVPLDPHGGS